jgi:hypothetical protein
MTRLPALRERLCKWCSSRAVTRTSDASHRPNCPWRAPCRIRTLENVVRHSSAAGTRKLRRELSWELSRLAGLERSVEETTDDGVAEELATKICRQAEVCLHLLDRYQSSVPGTGWSYAEKQCRPLRDDLKRTQTYYRAASGQMTRRAGQDLRSMLVFEPSPPSRPLNQSTAVEARPVSHVCAVAEGVRHNPTRPIPRGVYLWLEGDEPIALRAMSGKDPVELSAREARELGHALIELADLSDEMRTGSV